MPLTPKPIFFKAPSIPGFALGKFFIVFIGVLSIPCSLLFLITISLIFSVFSISLGEKVSVLPFGILIRFVYVLKLRWLNVRVIYLPEGTSNIYSPLLFVAVPFLS